MAIYFISDLHLHESREDITRAFHNFISRISSDAEQLYILGDFFESWIGDDENTPLQQEIKKTLKSLSDQGCKLFLMHGNRDFLIGKDFCQEVGATLLEDPSTIDLFGEPVLVMHGDSLCTKDEAYMKFRQTIRNPAFLAPFLARSIEDRRTTAQQLRAMSKQDNMAKAEDIMDVTPEEVVKEMQTKKILTLIHGHTHRPAIHDLILEQGPARRIVLGDWDSHLWYLKAEKKGNLQLLSEKI